MFEVLARSGSARVGRLATLHGVVETPVFMPVGTRGTVRTQTLAQLEELGAPMLLANTYDLLLRPGIEVFERFGGLHRFMGWNGSLLTDSGGFQVFSLAHARTIDDAGAAFQDVADGPRTLLSPETSIAMQRAIGSDVMMVMDLGHLERESGCSHVVPLTSGGAFLQTTTIDAPIIEGHHDDAVLARLARFLAPVM